MGRWCIGGRLCAVGFFSRSRCCLLPSLAQAFADPGQFIDPGANAPHAATLGASSEGIYFTGASRFAFQSCQDCHTNGPGVVRLTLDADTISLFDDGYEAGKTYELTVAITNESEGLSYNTPTCTDVVEPGDTFSYVQCNNNAFAFEADTNDVPLSGANIFCAAPPVNGVCPPADPFGDEAFVTPAGDAVFANRIFSNDPATPKLITRNDPTHWHFWWTAPVAGSGPVTFYVAAVDGNGASGTSDRDQDPYGDDTVQATFAIAEKGRTHRKRCERGLRKSILQRAIGLGPSAL